MMQHRTHIHAVQHTKVTNCANIYRTQTDTLNYTAYSKPDTYDCINWHQQDDKNEYANKLMKEWETLYDIFINRKLNGGGHHIHAAVHVHVHVHQIQ